MTGALAPAEPGLTGAQRAAALLVLLGEEGGGAIWSELGDGEVRALCTAIAELGAIPGTVAGQLAIEFAGALSSGPPVRGSADRAEELIAKVLPADRVAAVMADVRGAAGRQVWRRLVHVPPDALAGFFAGEYPQLIAVALSRIGADHGGRVLALLPDALATDVVRRMLDIGTVCNATLAEIEDALHRRFLVGGPPRAPADPYGSMADRFNAFDRATETRFLASLEASDPEAAGRVRAKMFTFADLVRLDAAGAQTLLRQVDKDALARALKGASEEIRAFFMGNMSQRAAKNLADDIEAMGAVRVKDVDEAQSTLVRLAKSLADKGEIRINKNRVDDEVVA